VDEFARRIEKSQEYANDLLQGRATITLAVARRLEHVLGASVEFWVSRDFQFRHDIARFFGADKDWLDEFPVGDMIKFRWLTPAPRPAEEVAACLRFFDVPSVSVWKQRYSNLLEMVAFRISPSLDSRPAAVTAWLRQGEIEGQAMACSPWDRRGFEESLRHVRPLTRERDPKQFIPKLQELCAAYGVAVAIVRTPNGCPASGATRFLSPSKAFLMLSFRYLSDDQFWFSFFHEAGHLLLHGDKGFFLEGNHVPSTIQEQAANDFAENILIPPEFRESMLRLPLNGREVIRFAHRIGISPGIVVGQLQFRGRFTHRQLNNLKRHYQWVE
jgi:Zn-dependent peptidase ImmA (M78 family)/transcriptional regulator with XRE-family HTH domain